MVVEVPGFGRWQDVYRGAVHHVRRAVREADGRRVIVKQLMADFPAPRHVAALLNEHELAMLAAGDGVVEPLDLLWVGGLPVLVVADAGPHSLNDRLVPGGLPLEVFLPLAIQITRALARLHDAGVVHRDINPGNVVLDATGTRATLIDLGLATRLGRVRAAPVELVQLTGTLGYLSPEQTGRTGLPVDQRSDLYSLGATLFAMLAGSAPFPGTDPRELVHAHLALEPSRLDDLRTDMPPLLADLVSRLLAKAPEDRYQSARGVLHDLQALAKGPDESGFELGGADRPSGLVIPQSLLGRAREASALRSAFADAVAGQPSLVVVEGSPGIGKTAVVERLRAPVLAAGGAFLSSKFDQVVRQEPFRGFAEAFGELVSGLLARGEVELGVWREELVERLGPQGAVLFGLVPGLERLLGGLPEVAEAGPAESRNRLIFTFRRFVWAFPKPDAPLVLFLDDVQWIDTGSLELLAGLAEDLADRSVLLVVALRPGEVGVDQPLPAVIDFLESRGTEVRRVRVEPLSAHGSRELVEEVLADRGPAVAELADELHARSGGNPLHLLSFLQFLAERDVLQFDSRAGGWRWDPERVAEVGLSDDVLALTLRQLGDLPEAAQRMLSAAAVSGARFELLELAALVDEPLVDVGRALAPAAASGLLEALDAAATVPLNRLDELAALDDLRVWFRFAHDRIQEAALARLAASDQELLHLRLARLRAAGDESPFASVDHYLLAGAALTDPDERLEAARKGLRAGTQAMAAAAFVAARRYLDAGLEWLRDWTRDRELMFALHRAAAEAAWLTGDHERSAALLAAALDHAADRHESSALHRLMVVLHGVGGEHRDAVAAGQRGLRAFGLELPEEDLDAALGAELAATEAMRAERPATHLLDAAPMQDEDAAAAFSVLTAMGPSLFFCDQRQCAIGFARMVRLSLEHGPAPGSGFALSFYGVLLASGVATVEEAVRVGELGVELERRGGHGGMLCRALHSFANHVRHWRKPLRGNEELFREAFRVGVAAGEHQFAAYAATGRAIHLLPSGKHLAEVAAHIDSALPFVVQARNAPMVRMLRAYRQAVRCLRGETLFAGSLEDGEFSHEQFLAECGEDPVSAGLYRVLAGQCAYLFGDLAGADLHLRAAEAGLPFVAGMVAEAQFELWDGLVAARLATERRAAGRAEAMARLDERIGQLERRAASAPANFAHQVLLLKAERHRLHERFSPALRSFEDAADAARVEGFPQDAALAYELAAGLLEQLEHRIGAEGYRRRAVQGWTAWGAPGKTTRSQDGGSATESLGLVALAEQSGGATMSDPTVPVAAVSHAGTGLSSVDLAAVLEAAEAIASELELSGLIRRLLRLCVELSGAQRGVLLMERPDGPELVAELATPGGFRLLDEPLAKTTRLPVAVVRYVRRTRAAVVEGDAAARGLFSRDPWVRQHRSRSVLCVPALKQRRLVAMLYLENELVPGAFSDRQVELLRLLGAQVAVALENAALFERVRSESRDRLRAERQLQQAQKMESVGRLASGVAHDFNNLLGVILGYSSLLGDEVDPRSTLREPLEQIGRAAERGAELTRRLLAFSRSAVAQPQALDLPELVEGMTRMLDRLLPDNTRLVVEHDGRPIPARADPALLEQVLVNLVVNARDAMPAGGTITVQYGIDDRAGGSLPPGRYVQLAVRDEGVGIPPDLLDRIFEPFFTTKAVGDGTGLGLSTCLGIVQQSGGEMLVDSEVGRGTRFVVVLPAADPAELDSSTHSATIDGGGPLADARLLLVEDEPTMRRLLADALGRQGYAVSLAAHGAEAWEKLQAGLDVDLILTDLTMPEMDGLELIRLARSLRPDLPVALLSGLSESLSEDEIAQAQPLLLLQKPIRPDDLAAALHDLLHGPPA